VLSESEREMLREIQRRLSNDDPDFERYFHVNNILTDAQIAALTVPPAPRRRAK
jgi:hypothetical protein